MMPATAKPAACNRHPHHMPTKQPETFEASWPPGAPDEALLEACSVLLAFVAHLLDGAGGLCQACLSLVQPALYST
jgi:hypothetical protein